MEESKVDWELFARAPDLSTGGGMKEGRVVLLAEVVEGVNQDRKRQENVTQVIATQGNVTQMEAPENLSENALMGGGGDEEANGNLLEEDVDDLGERENQERPPRASSSPPKTGTAVHVLRGKPG